MVDAIGRMISLYFTAKSSTKTPEEHIELEVVFGRICPSREVSGWSVAVGKGPLAIRGYAYPEQVQMYLIYSSIVW